MKLSYPALNNEPVTQAHVNYCAANGHATHTVDGVITGVCPRCGEVTTVSYGTCPAVIMGQHTIEWLDVPAYFHNGAEVAPAGERGFCWNCDERFTR